MRKPLALSMKQTTKQNASLNQTFEVLKFFVNKLRKISSLFAFIFSSGMYKRYHIISLTEQDSLLKANTTPYVSNSVVISPVLLIPVCQHLQKEREREITERSSERSKLFSKLALLYQNEFFIGPFCLRFTSLTSIWFRARTYIILLSTERFSLSPRFRQTI